MGIRFDEIDWSKYMLFLLIGVFLGSMFYIGVTYAQDFNTSLNQRKELCVETDYPFYKSSTSSYVVCLNERGEKLLIDKNEGGV